MSQLLERQLKSFEIATVFEKLKIIKKVLKRNFLKLGFSESHNENIF